ncbi:MAG: response regulator [Deltaproteobacteria bacterium]|jgi:CheY-like chemotaxis protein|nr:response regulator [Deltaproteobacteria bacterium]
MIEIESMSILIVDDMKSMRLTIRKMLQNLKIGSNLMFAENGREGLEILHKVNCDIAIVDWNMPVMNGIEMLDRIRNDKNLRDMPVIMVTAESKRDVVSDGAENEIDAYLLKPLTLEILDERIRTVVGKVNNPDPATIHRLKARDLEEKQDYKGAIEQIRNALKYNPSASRLLRQLGLLYFKVKKPGIAEKCLLKAASVNKQDIITRVRLTDFYIKQNELEKAAQYFLEILSLSTKYNEKAMFFAEKLLTGGSKRLAFEIFSKIIIRSKKYNAARERVINICLDHNEFEYSLSLLEQSLKKNPSNYEIAYKAGLVCLEADDTEKALNYFIEVDRHIKDHVNAKFQIAKILVHKGKVIPAENYLTQILRIDQTNKDALALRREISL